MPQRLNYAESYGVPKVRGFYPGMAGSSQRARSATERRMTFGFTAREAAFLRRLTPECRIQQFLDDIDYDVAGRACRSPRRVLRERRVQCLDGALFAAAALRLQGH